jgi:hypothetical protein
LGKYQYIPVKKSKTHLSERTETVAKKKELKQDEKELIAAIPSGEPERI